MTTIDTDYQSDAVREFMLKADQSVPPTPTIPPPEIRVLRAKLILEEALETINKGLGLDVHINSRFIRPLTIEGVAFIESNEHEPNLVELADGCADLKVVTIGTEIACGINGAPVFEEVMRSNMSKFPTTTRADGKILKGPNYTAPNILPILKEQGL